MASPSKRRISPFFPLLFTVFGGGIAMSSNACGDDGSGGSGAAGSTTSGTAGGGGDATSTSTGPGGGNTGGAGGSGGGGGGNTGGSTGAGGTIDCGPMPSDTAPPLQLTQIAAGLDRPLLVTSPPNDATRLFVVQQAGAIRLIQNGALLPTPFVNLEALVQDPSGESEFGLLGLVFHPDYEQNRRFFVFYVANNGDSVLVEYLRSANDPNVADETPVQALLTISAGGGNHYAGMLAFGPDGYLYVTSGDRGTAITAQDLADRRGKILRFDVDNHPTPPPGNMPGADPYVWDYGVRNPWRYSFDRCSGDLYFGEVGGAFEEINVEPAGQGHRNYGWPTVDTGVMCNVNQDCTGVTLSVVEDNHGTNNCSYVGGHVYRGSVIQGLNGRYLYGDYCTNRIYSFVWMGGGTIGSQQELSVDLNSTTLLNGLSSFGEDAAGNLYVTSVFGGAVFRIDPE